MPRKRWVKLWTQESLYGSISKTNSKTNSKIYSTKGEIDIDKYFLPMI